MKVRTWCLMGLFSFFNFLSGCKSDINKEVTNFKWYAVATAPKGYPMEIIDGTFYCKGLDIGISTPSGGTLTTGWGKSASAYVGSDEISPLPDRVKVKFYSYIEKQVYEAEFELPYDLILEKFQEKKRLSSDGRSYSSFLIGVAPGGAVSVWLNGSPTVEIYFGQAKKVESEPSKDFDLPFTSEEQSDDYTSLTLIENVTPEQLEHIKKYGAPIGMWARYRNLYKWVPVYKDGKKPAKEKMPVTYLNGEFYKTPTQFNEQQANTPRPLPWQLNFRARVDQDNAPVYEIEFEPIELMEAFEKLGANGGIVYIEFDPQVPRQNMKIRVYKELEPEDGEEQKKIIELSKFTVEPEL